MTYNVLMGTLNPTYSLTHLPVEYRIHNRKTRRGFGDYVYC